MISRLSLSLRLSEISMRCAQLAIAAEIEGPERYPAGTTIDGVNVGGRFKPKNATSGGLSEDARELTSDFLQKKESILQKFATSVRDLVSEAIASPLLQRLIYGAYNRLKIKSVSQINKELIDKGVEILAKEGVSKQAIEAAIARESQELKRRGYDSFESLEKDVAKILESPEIKQMAAKLYPHAEIEALIDEDPSLGRKLKDLFDKSGLLSECVATRRAREMPFVDRDSIGFSYRKRIVEAAIAYGGQVDALRGAEDPAIAHRQILDTLKANKKHDGKIDTHLLLFNEAGKKATEMKLTKIFSQKVELVDMKRGEGKAIADRLQGYAKELSEITGFSLNIPFMICDSEIKPGNNLMTFVGGLKDVVAFDPQYLDKEYLDNLISSFTSTKHSGNVFSFNKNLVDIDAVRRFDDQTQKERERGYVWHEIGHEISRNNPQLTKETGFLVFDSYNQFGRVGGFTDFYATFVQPGIPDVGPLPTIPVSDAFSLLNKMHLRPFRSKDVYNTEAFSIGVESLSSANYAQYFAQRSPEQLLNTLSVLENAK